MVTLPPTFSHPPSHIFSPPLIQVLDLLDSMNLSQYKVKFEKECVTGSVLSNCDDEVLCSELGVTQRLHRIRLHTLISGEDSAIRFLSGKAVSRTCH